MPGYPRRARFHPSISRRVGATTDTPMTRTTNRALLPAALRARLEAGGITRGEYHRLIPTLPDDALCDHAEVYAGHCAAVSLPADHAHPEAYLHHFILPELVARLGATHAAELSRPDPGSIFRRLIADWDAFAARVEAAIREQQRLAALGHTELAATATAARARVHCRWEPGDPVYDGVIHHTILPELVRRVAALSETDRIHREVHPLIGSVPV